MFAYIKEKNDFLDLLLLHIGTSAIVDYLIKLLRDAEPDEMKNKFVEVRILMTNCRKITIRNNLGYFLKDLTPSTACIIKIARGH